jgi:polysaccharide export outer membrane protein
MRSSRVISVLLLCCLSRSVLAAEVAEGSQQPGPDHAAEHSTYYLQPGDVLDISVWKETDLQKEILVRPDGSFTFPLVGEVDARGKSVEEVRATLADRLKRYVPSPVVTVALKQIGGNRIYVLGRVNHAGEFTFTRAIDVMQAISLAGGTTPFAALNDIVILHRHNGQQEAFKFHYPDVARGRELSQNIELESGDTVVVP